MNRFVHAELSFSFVFSPLFFLSVPYKAGDPRPNGFIFQGKSWQGCGLHVEELQTIFRQSDRVFQQLLLHIRNCVMDEADLGRLAALTRPIAMPTAELRPTLLYCKNRNVDHINDTALAKIDSPTVAYLARVPHHNFNGHEKEKKKKTKRCV